MNKDTKFCPKCNRATVPAIGVITEDFDSMDCPLMINGPDTHPDICRHRWEMHGTSDAGDPHYIGMTCFDEICYQCGSTRVLVEEAKYKIDKHLNQ